MVQNVVSALTCSATCLQIPNVAFDHAELGATFDAAQDIIDVSAMSC